jgi:tetratricopeptide (TPR) repeat protein
MHISFVIALFAAPLFASVASARCPEPPDVRREILNLVEDAHAAKTFMDGRRVSGQMWLVWLRAPNEQAQTYLDAGMARRDVADFAAALVEFNKLVHYCPTYAEGWNQRAYIHFLRQDYETALLDLDVAIKLQPLHVAAQSGRALTLMNMGRRVEARAQMLQALDNNPWLSERALVQDGAPLGLQGQEL